MRHRPTTLLATALSLSLATPPASGQGEDPASQRRGAGTAPQRDAPQKIGVRDGSDTGQVGLLAASAVQLALEELRVVEGPLAAAAARATLDGVRARLQVCLATIALAPGAKGIVELTLQLGPAHRPRAALRPAAARSAAVDACLRQAIEGAPWPTLAAQSRVTVRLAHRSSRPAGAGSGALWRDELSGDLGGLRLHAKVARRGTVRVDWSAVKRRGSGLDLAQIRGVLEPLLPHARFCYERRLVAAPRTAGTIQLRFVIGPSGAVTEARGRAGRWRDPELQACLEQLLRRSRFPAPRQGQVGVDCPFVFEPRRR